MPKSLTLESDEIVAVAVQAGDGEAFGILIERYEAKLRRYGRRFLSRSQDIEDLVQDALVKAYTNLKSFDANQRFSPWLYRITHNTFVNELRRQKRSWVPTFDPDTVLPLLTAKETADADTLETELRSSLEQCLETLDPKYRAPLILYFFEELSYQEIAAVLGIPKTTVGVRIKRGKEKVHHVYDKQVTI